MTVTVWKYPKRDEWKVIMARPQMDLISLSRTVSDILESVRCEGDDALRRYEKQFDRVVLDALQVTPAEMEEGIAAVPESLKKAIRQAIDNIRKFHASQAIEVKKVETTPGVWCWQKPVGIEKVGLYVPGGTAPLFSTVLMLAVPARLAGCHEIVMCTPPGKEGKIAPAILYAARETGIDRIFKLGGVQAIGAMAFGTESVPQVYKIFGPGNRYVMAAKQQVSVQGVAIDMPAGPSEVMIVADSGADVRFLAAMGTPRLVVIDKLPVTNRRHIRGAARPVIVGCFCYYRSSCANDDKTPARTLEMGNTPILLQPFQVQCHAGGGI